MHKVECTLLSDDFLCGVFLIMKFEHWIVAIFGDLSLKFGS